MNSDKFLIVLIATICLGALVSMSVINQDYKLKQVEANHTIDSLTLTIKALEHFNDNLNKTIVKDFKAFSYINCPNCQKKQEIDTFDLITFDDTRSQINKCKYCNSLFQISKTLVVSKFKL